MEFKDRQTGIDYLSQNCYNIARKLACNEVDYD